MTIYPGLLSRPGFDVRRQVSCPRAQVRHYMKLRLEVTLDDDGDEADVRALLEVIDPQGVVLQSRTGASTLMRILFKPLE